jgi:ferrous iron transport protein B
MIYALIIPAFFPLVWRGPMLWIIYFVGIALAVLCARLLRKTLLAGASTPFVMELPPYRMPTVNALLRHTWQRAWMYVRKAGTMILGASIILWALAAFPRTDAGREEALQEMQDVRAAAVGRLDAVANQAGIEPEPLRQAARAELQLQIAQQAHWPDTPEYQAAAQQYQQRIDELTEGQDTQRLAALLATVEQLRQARDSFETAVEQQELEEGSARYDLLQRDLQDRVDQLRREKAEVFAAAVAYLEQFAEPLDARLREIDNRLQANALAHSFSGRIGKAMEPGLELMGFDWRIGTALIGASAAKEVFVSQMGIVYAAGEADDQSETLQAQLRNNYTPLIGLCVMLFCLIGTPCIGTVAVTWREAGGGRWAALQWGGLTVLAFVVTTMVYQVGRLVT